MPQVPPHACHASPSWYALQPQHHVLLVHIGFADFERVLLLDIRGEAQGTLEHF